MTMMHPYPLAKKLEFHLLRTYLTSVKLMTLSVWLLCALQQVMVGEKLESTSKRIAHMEEVSADLNSTQCLLKIGNYLFNPKLSSVNVLLNSYLANYLMN